MFPSQRSPASSLSRRQPGLPWSRVPTHLLDPAAGSMQVRCYSSDRRENDGESSPRSESVPAPASRLASALGFQSLSGLFEQPGGRYSTTREAKPVGSDHSPLDSQDTGDGKLHGGIATQKDHGSSEQQMLAALNSTSADSRDKPKSSTIKADSQQEIHSPTADSQQDQISAEIEATFRSKYEPARAAERISAVQASPRGSLTQSKTRRARSRTPDTIRRSTTGERRRRNPFADSLSRQTVGGEAFRQVTISNAVTPIAKRPWGLSAEDTISVDSILDPGASVNIAEAPDVTLSGGTPAEAQPVSEDLKATLANRIASTAGPQLKSRLTHLTSTGTAHMVDVGAKPDSRRVAVATAFVRFSRVEPAQLIEENNNKKGDVLGVARIAGIMAAKRTSDLIPLCHPIAISKVEVDLSVFRPGQRTAISSWLPKNPHGIVAVQARVDCTGPTGVEMEALTAASSAALTVYDMCKAVDKDMVIGQTQVVYKSGGTSGLYAKTLWSRHVGTEWFAERGLEIPAEAASRVEPSRQSDPAQRADNSAIPSSASAPIDRTATDTSTPSLLPAEEKESPVIKRYRVGPELKGMLRPAIRTVQVE